jgi:hypothetical protein
VALSGRAHASGRRVPPDRVARSAALLPDPLRRRSAHSPLRSPAGRAESRDLRRSRAREHPDPSGGPLHGVERPVSRPRALLADPAAARVSGRHRGRGRRGRPDRGAPPERGRSGRSSQAGRSRDGRLQRRAGASGWVPLRSRDAGHRRGHECWPRPPRAAAGAAADAPFSRVVAPPTDLWREGGRAHLAAGCTVVASDCWIISPGRRPRRHGPSPAHGAPGYCAIAAAAFPTLARRARISLLVSRAQPPDSSAPASRPCPPAASLPEVNGRCSAAPRVGAPGRCCQSESPGAGDWVSRPVARGSRASSSNPARCRALSAACDGHPIRRVVSRSTPEHPRAGGIPPPLGGRRRRGRPDLRLRARQLPARGGCPAGRVAGGLRAPRRLATPTVNAGALPDVQPAVG